MKKRIIVFILLTVLSLNLIGCGENQIPELSEEQMKAIGEYTALTLMKYDVNHRSRLVELDEELIDEGVEQKPSAIEENPEVPEEDVTGDNSGISESEETFPEDFISFEKAIGLPEGIFCSYLGEEICDSYPSSGETASFAVSASDGKKLMVLTFELVNQSGSSQKINMLSNETIFRIRVNEDYTRRPLLTMLPDDFTTYVEELDDGERAEVTLVIELEESLAAYIDSVSLNLKNEAKTYTIQLL